jgi:Winged helix DNA-binding domain
VGSSLPSALDVVRWFGAVQSQDVPGAMWAVAQRMDASPTLAEIGVAYDAGEIVRTHVLRPTWHFVAPDELRWLEALTGPRVQRANDHVGRRRLGIDRATFDRANGVIRSTLAGGPLGREELRAALAEAGIPFADPNTLGHVLMNAELDGVICSGPRRGRQFTYAVVDDRIAPAAPRDPDDALRDLTIRYFTSHGPALVHDMAWWSGLTVTDVRHGVELAGDALEQRVIDGKTYVAGRGGFEPAVVPEPHVLMLSNYDEYLGSYTDYSPIFADSLPKTRTVADVLGVHIVVRDGLVVGGWRRSLRPDRAIATVTLIVPLTTTELDALAVEAERWARFIGLPPGLRVTSAT